MDDVQRCHVRGRAAGLGTIPCVGWTFFFIMVVLKIPILLLMWIVWWSTRPVEDPSSGDDDGGLRVGGERHPMHPRPHLPRAPRRGPHGQASVPAPRRVRSVVSRASEPA